MTELDTDIADDVPWSNNITLYDEQHFVIYIRLLDAEADGADWQEVARIVLHCDPMAEPYRSRRCWEEHLKRAKWMTEHGYRQLLIDARGARHPKDGKLH
ncbi:MAG: DNA -binding domain-containing protein [Acidimicrobiales bacterium]